MEEIMPTDAVEEVTIPMLDHDTDDPQHTDVEANVEDKPPIYGQVSSPPPVQESPIKESPFKKDPQRTSFKKLVEDSKPSLDVPEVTTEIPLLADKMPALRQVVNDAVSQKELSELIAQRTKERRAKLVEKFVGALTLHGYSHFHEARGPRKVLWAMILLASAAFFIGLTYLSYYSDSYYSQNVDRTSEASSEVEFPTITMCNFNPVYAHDMHTRLPFKISHREFLTFYYTMISNRGNIYGVNNKPAVDKVRKLFEQNGITSYSEMLNYFEISEKKDIHPDVITEIIGEGCQFENRGCDIDKDFRTVFRNAGQSVCKQFNYFKGKTFNNGKGIASNTTGMNGGLSMYWSIEGKQYHYSSKNGLLVEIHHYGTPQHLIDYNDVLSLEPGVFTTIELKQIKSNRLPPPFQPNCGTRNFKVITGYDYSQAMCKVDCLLDITLAECKCVGDQFKDYLKPEFKKKVCTLDQMKCVFKVDAKDTHETCHEVCPPECSAVMYKMTTSRMAIGNNMMYELFESLPARKNSTRQETESYIKENIVGFRIVFKKLEVEVEKWSVAVKWYERISMVGGSIGLLLGFSFITGCELVFFLFDYITTPMYIRASRKHFGDEWRKARKNVVN